MPESLEFIMIPIIRYVHPQKMECYFCLGAGHRTHNMAEGGIRIHNSRASKRILLSIDIVSERTVCTVNSGSVQVKHDRHWNWKGRGSKEGGKGGLAVNCSNCNRACNDYRN